VAVLDSIEAEYDVRTGRLEEAETRLQRALPVLRKRFSDGGLYTRQAVARLESLYKERDTSHSGAKR
jgi:hypothetical protein